MITARSMGANICPDTVFNSASKSSIRRFVITEKAPTTLNGC